MPASSTIPFLTLAPISLFFPHIVAMPFTLFFSWPFASLAYAFYATHIVYLITCTPSQPFFPTKPFFQHALVTFIISLIIPPSSYVLPRLAVHLLNVPLQLLTPLEPTLYFFNISKTMHMPSVPLSSFDWHPK